MGRFLVVVRFALTLALLATVMTTAQPATAQPAPIPNFTSIDLGSVEAREMIVHEPSQRIVVSGDDKIEFFDLSGERTGTIENVAGAADLTEAGDFAALVDQASQELIVIDPATATIVKRIDVAPAIPHSVESTDDRLWFTYEIPAVSFNVGRVSIDTEVVETALLPRGAVFSPTDAMHMSSAHPDRVYLVETHSGLLSWYQTDGAFHDVRGQARASTLALGDTGDVVWTTGEDAILRHDADTFAELGSPIVGPGTSTGRYGQAIDLSPDQRIAVAANRSVLQFDTSGTLLNHSRFTHFLTAIALTETMLVATTSDSSLAGAGGIQANAKLVIMGRDAPTPRKVVDIDYYGHGEPPTSIRSQIRYQCGAVEGSSIVAYGTGLDLFLVADTDRCDFEVTRWDLPLDRELFTGGDSQTRWPLFFFYNDPALDWVEIVDYYPSVFNDTDIFTRTAFRDILNRNPTQAEYRSWAAWLVADKPPERLITSLVESPDYLGRVAPITRLYDSYFNRQPDDAGITFWVGASRDGWTLPRISNFFAGSPEFQRTYGNVSDDRFIDLVYRNVLKRPADTQGKAYWQGRMRRGMSRGEVMVDFSESAENVNRTQAAIVVRSLYYGLLRREPDAGGAAFWEGVYKSGSPLDALASGFFRSDEYYNRFWLDEDHLIALARTDESRDDPDTAPTSHIPANATPRPFDFSD